MQTTRFQAPFGDLALFSSGKLLCGLAFDDRADRVVQHLKRHHPDAAIEPGGVAEPFVKALRAYFSGDLSAIDGLEVDPPRHSFPNERVARAAAYPGGRNALVRPAGAGPFGRPTLCEPSEPRTAPTLSRSSSRAIASSTRAADSAATEAGSTASAGCSRTNRRGIAASPSPGRWSCHSAGRTPSS